MSKFTELLHDVDDDCDEVFGDLTLIEPKTTGEVFASSPDPSRKSFELVGIVENETIMITGKGERNAQADKVDVQVSAMSVSYQERRLLSNFFPKAGDEIVFLEENGQPRGRVTRIAPDGEGRVTVYLDRIKK